MGRLMFQVDSDTVPPGDGLAYDSQNVGLPVLRRLGVLSRRLAEVDRNVDFTFP